MALAFANLILFGCFACLSAAAEEVVAFSGASASSIFQTSGFGPELALEPGSGYWCSSGSHKAGAVVTWTGVLDARVSAVGLKINWAYGPGEVKILTGDGDNLAEASGWQTSVRTETAYGQTIMFDAPVNAKSVTLAMRSPMPWGYFGISSVELLAKPFSFMLVSSEFGGKAEKCLVAAGSRIRAQSCLESVVAADGRDIWSLSEDGRLSSNSGQCLMLASGDATDGGRLHLADCGLAAAEDGRGVWSMGPAGQLKLKDLGNFCLRASDFDAKVQNCDDLALEAVGGNFFKVAVPEHDPAAAASSQDAASLLRAAVSRQRVLLANLRAAASQCGVSLSLAQSAAGLKTTKGTDETAMMAKLDSTLGLDSGVIAEVLAETRAALNEAKAKI